MNYIAVQGCKFNIDVSGTGSVQIVTPPNMNVKIDGKNVYCGVLSIIVNITAGGWTGAGVINSGSKTTKADGQNVALVGDGVNVSITNPKGDTSSVYVSIADAGQYSIKSD